MRIVNRNKETITEYDLTAGRLISAKIIREDAEPLGTVITTEKDGKPVEYKKIAWADEDYEEVQMYITNPVKTIAEKIVELKRHLSDTDYKVIKCVECQLLGLEMPYDVEVLHTERQAIRNKINQLEEE